MHRRLLAATAALLALPACGGDGPEAAPRPAPTSSAGGSIGASAGTSAGSTSAPTVVVTAGDSGPVRAEVADDEQEREVGLMGRTSVPLGTGMVFRYAVPSRGRYYMFHVPVPLTAVFARSGVVVGVLDMPPCTEQQAQACPTYGPDREFDTVLETAPETVRGKVTNGDLLRVG